MRILFYLKKHGNFFRRRKNIFKFPSDPKTGTISVRGAKHSVQFVSLKSDAFSLVCLEDEKTFVWLRLLPAKGARQIWPCSTSTDVHGTFSWLSSTGTRWCHHLFVREAIPEQTFCGRTAGPRKYLKIPPWEFWADSPRTDVGINGKHLTGFQCSQRW